MSGNSNRIRYCQRSGVFIAALAGVLLATAPARAASLIFSEIMYHPVDASGVITNGDEYEFIELYNAGSTNFPLSAAQFTAGISYTFTNNAALAPGQYVVVVKNRAAFTNRYPAVANIAATNFTGSLANGGEQVTLKTSGGTTIYAADYLTAPPWPTWPDGQGSSLLLLNYDGDPDDGTNWCASAQYNGTPGATGACATSDIVINEALAHTDPPQEDAIELYNNSAGAIDMSGWYLSDDAAVRKKYRITNTVIAAKGFKVFYEYQFNTNASFNTNNIPFELSSDNGDRVYLTAADAATNLTRIVDLQSFEASENGVSFGLYPNGTGSFVTLSQITFGTTNAATLPIFRGGLGATNALPKVGPIVISEIMYHPANNSPDEEFIELFNTSGSTVPLYDVAYPSNTWKLTTAVDFVFPTNLSMAGGSRILFVGTTNIAAFRALHNLSNSVPVYGAWTGQLDNAGESVRLYRPDNPNVDGFVPYVLVDRVDYGDASPWPTGPDGNGPSLERVASTNLGNLASNWFTGSPGGSPGAAPAGGFVNPIFSPAAPLNGQAFTVTVSIVAQPLPTQVIFRTSINGVTSNRVMRDNGVAPDAVSNDLVYSVALAAPTNQWVYYQFAAYAGGAEAFILPSRETKFITAPVLTLGDCDVLGFHSTVTPTEMWTTYQSSGVIGSTNCFQLYFTAAGEALVDDIQMLDPGGTNHLRNSSFTTNLANWFTNSGNHSASTRDVLVDEGSNGVLHVRATGAGNVTSFFDSISANLSPNMSAGQSATLSFRTRDVSYAVDNWFSLLVGTMPADVVINEIMYHPSQTDELPYEYIELYNPSASPVDLSNWILDGLGDFHFPTGSTIAANGFLVAAHNSNIIATAYGINNVVGDWNGQLSNSGETLTLFNQFGRQVDIVSYNDHMPWPLPADGYGPSLERLNPSSPGSTSVNWLASFANPGWRQSVWTGMISAANSGIRFYLDFDGMCWIDDVSVAPVGTTNSMLPNGGFENGTNGWTGMGNHARSRSHDGQGRSGKALALFGNETRYIYPSVTNGFLLAYGDSGSNHVRSAALPTTNGATYVVTWWARRERLGENVYAALIGKTNSIALGLHGTPGTPNSTATTNAPIQITSVTQASNIVVAGYSNIVRAQIVPVGLVSNVTLKYHVCGTNTYMYTDRDYSNITMKDDGVAPDLSANDGQYAAYAPAVTSNLQLVRYQIYAAASNGFSTRSPASDDPSADYGFWVENALSQTNIPNWNILVDGNPVRYPINSRCCAVSPDGQVFTDIEIRHRGRATTSDPGGAIRAGFALRMFNGHLYDTWFAPSQDGINFRSRLNDHDTASTRLICEPLAYAIQKQLGFPAPRFRYIVAWINGDPSITVELEEPQDAFLTGNDIDTDDYLSRVGYTGRGFVAGDPALDNFDVMKRGLLAATNGTKTQVVRANVWYESVQRSMAFLSAVGDGDQYFDWNMFQHRRSSDGRWDQFAWDLDIAFDTVVELSYSQLTNMHPYYATQLHPNMWDTNFYTALAQVLFYPESGPYSDETLPYRHRQQTTLWRDCNTWFTTNVLSPRVDAMQATLAPVYTQLNFPIDLLTSKVVEVKQFVASRRDFLMNQAWSDKNAALWAATNAYNPSNVVINEIMYSPVSGGEYLELYNPGSQFLDLSFWHIRSGEEIYNLPFGTMLGPTSYLVIADTQSTLTNAYTELGAADSMIERFPGDRLWDFPIVFTTATEYASRVLEVDALTLSNTGATIQVLDNFSNVMDVVSYSANAPWPAASGVALELINPLANNDTPTNWRASLIVGTPGNQNAANADGDGDSMNDGWEQQYFGTLTNGVAGDFDGDGLNNKTEFILGTDPSANDDLQARINIALTNAAIRVAFNTMLPTGSAYDVYSGRFYTLGRVPVLSNSWLNVTNFIDLPATGQPMSYTNPVPMNAENFRYDVELRYKR